MIFPAVSRKTGAALLLGLALAGAAVAWRCAATRDERLIRRTLERLAAAVSRDPGASPAARALLAGNLLQYFTEDFAVTAGDRLPYTFSRQDVPNFTLSLRGYFGAFRVRVLEAVTRVDDSGQEAVTELAVETTGFGAGPGDAAFDVQEFVVHWRRDGGRWRIARLTAAPAVY